MSDIEPAKCEKHKKDSPALTCSECLEDAIAEVRRLRELAGKAECYYCGHVSNRGVEVLAHIQECSVHPMNLVISFGRKIKELTAERDRLSIEVAANTYTQGMVEKAEAEADKWHKAYLRQGADIADAENENNRLKSELAQARERLAKMEHEQKEYDFGKLREKVWDWKFRGCPETSFYDGNLPNISVKSDVVQIFKNRFSEFRDRYFMLFAFACAVIGKEDFSIFDIENYLRSKYTEPSTQRRNRDEQKM